MTVGSQVKSCYASVKAAQASFEMLANKTRSEETKEVFSSGAEVMLEIKDDLEKQVTFLAHEEPQYK